MIRGNAMSRENTDRWLGGAISILLLVQVFCGVILTGMTRPQDFLIAQALSVALLGLFTARIWVSRKLELHWPPVCWFVLAFVGYFIVRAATADVAYVAQTELLRLLVYWATFVIAMQSFRSRAGIRTAVLALLALALASSIYAGYQAAIDPDHVLNLVRPKEYGYGRRGSGFFINPNNLACMLAMILPLILAFSMISRFKPLTKIFLGYACLILVVGIGLTLSRGGWIATFSAVLVYFAAVVRMRRHRAAALIAAVSLVCLGGVFISQSVIGKARLKRAVDFDSKANVRYAIWETAWNMWLDNPATGAGPGHFDRRYREFRSHEMQARPERAHNDYVNALADLGIVGFGLAMAAIASLFVSAQATWRRIYSGLSEDSSQRSDRLALCLGLSCSLIAMLFHALFDFPAHIPGLALLFAFLMGILAAQSRHQKPKKSRKPLSINGKSIITPVAILTTLYLAWTGIVRFREFRQLDRAFAPEVDFAGYVEILETAHRIAPANPDTPFYLAEAYRRQSWKSPPDLKEKAELAIKWFEKAIELDPFDSECHLRLGQCHDWLDRPDEAWTHYEKGLELDPEGFFSARIIGWHYLQRDDLASARRWYELSVLRHTAPENYVSLRQLEFIENALESDSKTEN